VGAAIVLGLFIAALVACSVAGVPVVVALLGGFALFFGYGVARGHGWGAMARAALEGLRPVAKILATFVLIGMLTAVWRASGTIAGVVVWTAPFCSGAAVLPATFVLCCLVSFCTGTSFGTAATMGVVCMAVAHGAGTSPLLTGGAVLAGAFFGDRCSPLSTSALLMGTLTRTAVVDNIPRMMRSSAVPFALTCAAYVALGLLAGNGGGAAADGEAVAGLAASYELSPWVLLPAALVLGLSALRVDVRLAMAAGVASAGVLACALQGMGPAEVARTCITGFAPTAPGAQMLAGGGVTSMANVFAIVLVSSTYAGLFAQTRLLDGVQGALEALARRGGPFAAVLAASVGTSLVACNQTLAIMLSHQLCRDIEPRGGDLAAHLENTAVVIPALVPWSIAGAVPLATVGAPATSVFAAVYLWLLPLWNLAVEARARRRRDGRG